MHEAEHIAAYFEPPPMQSLLAGIAPADVHNRDPRTITLISSAATTLGDGVLAQHGNVVFCQLPPYSLADSAQEQLNIRRTYRRLAFTLTRLLGNLGVRGDTPLLSHFSRPVGADGRRGPCLRRARWPLVAGTVSRSA